MWCCVVCGLGCRLVIGFWVVLWLWVYVGVSVVVLVLVWFGSDCGF